MGQPLRGGLHFPPFALISGVMILGRTLEEAAPGAADVTVNGRDYRLTGFVGAAPVRGFYQEGAEAADDGLPQGFLVDQPPGAVTNPHFHETNQFQVFVGGSGTFGKHEIAPLTVQYANGHTPYGPITAGPEGLLYYTLRGRWDPGAKYMPASRDKLIKGNQRQRLIDGVHLSSEDEMASRWGAEFELILDEEPDGLSAYLARFGPDATASVPSADGSGGQYWVVVGGTMTMGGKEYPKLSCLFAPADDPSEIIGAGPGGMEMLVLQLPEKNHVGLAAS